MDTKRIRKVISFLLVVVMLVPGFIFPQESAAAENWLWPLDGWGYDCISSSYGYRGTPYNRQHNGVDISGRNISGAPVYASKSGTVTYATFNNGGYGNRIVLSHGGGYESSYSHLSKIEVKKGEQVVKGQRIGTVGNTGGNYGYHLHFEIMLNGKFVNPNPKGQPIKGDSLKSANGGKAVAGNILYDCSGYGAAGVPIADRVKGVKTTANGRNVTVSWNVSKNATSYDVYLIQSPWGWDDVKYHGSTTSTSYNFKNVALGFYSSFVIARPQPDDQKASQWVDVNVDGKTSTTASIPTGVKATGKDKTVKVTWNASKNATSYDVYLLQEPWSWYDIKYRTNTTATSATFNNVKAGHYVAFLIARPQSDDAKQSQWVDVDVVNHTHIKSIMFRYNK